LTSELLLFIILHLDPLNSFLESFQFLLFYKLLHRYLLLSIY